MTSWCRIISFFIKSCSHFGSKEHLFLNITIIIYSKCSYILVLLHLDLLLHLLSSRRLECGHNFKTFPNGCCIVHSSEWSERWVSGSPAASEDDEDNKKVIVLAVLLHFVILFTFIIDYR